MRLTTEDIVLFSALVVGTVGSIAASYKMSKYHREVRIYRKIKLEMPFGVWPFAQGEEPKTMPKWLIPFYDWAYRDEQ